MLRVFHTMKRDSEQQTLAAFVKATRTGKGLSLPDVERNSGGLITNGYVWKIENDLVKRPSLKILLALAKGLGIAPEELFHKAGGADQSEEEFRKSRMYLLFEAWQTGSEELKRSIDDMVGMLLTRAEAERNRTHG